MAAEVMCTFRQLGPAVCAVALALGGPALGGPALAQDAFDDTGAYEEVFSGSTKVTDVRVMSLMQRSLFERGYAGLSDGFAVLAPVAGDLCVEVQSRDGRYRGWRRISSETPRWGRTRIETTRPRDLNAYGGEGLAVSAVAGPVCGDEAVSASERDAVIAPIAASADADRSDFVLIAFTSGQNAELVVYGPAGDEEGVGICGPLAGGAAFNSLCTVPEIAFQPERESYLVAQRADGGWPEPGPQNRVDIAPF